MITGILAWLTDPANTATIGRRVLEHLEYSLLATAVAALIAIPIGLWIGHTGRGSVVAVGLAGAARAIPSLGLLYLFVVWLSPLIGGNLAFYIPNMLVLIVLAIPPILSGAYSGVAAVDPAARDAAKGMGMRGPQVLSQVEIPCAMPLLFSGVQSALLQVIATATIAATAGMGGLGRFLIDGLAVRDYYQMAGGAVLVALLALAVDFVMGVIRRLVTSPGIGGGLGGGIGGSRRRSHTTTGADRTHDAPGQTSDSTNPTDPANPTDLRPTTANTQGSTR